MRQKKMSSVRRASFCEKPLSKRDEMMPVFCVFAHVEKPMRLMTVYVYLTSYSLTLQSPAIKIDTDVS